MQTLDGQWRALDGRVLHKAAVAASERYNTRLEAQLMARLDVMFAGSPGNEGKRPVRELVGLEPHLLDRWSSRRRAITARQSELDAEFTRVYGRQPDAGELHDLFDRANTSTRPHRHGPRSIAEQRAAWWAEAVGVLGNDDAVRDMLHTIAVRSQTRDDVLWQIARRLG